MKRLLAVFVLLAVLGACVPSYGAPVADFVLVYKVTISGKAVDTGDEEIVKAKIPAYLVLSIIEEVTGAEIIYAGLVMYGKLDGQKRYDTVDYVDDAVLSLLGPDDDIALVTMAPPDSEVIMFGKVKFVNIGLPVKKWIPTSLTGGMLFNGNFFGLTDIVGSGTISAKLDSKLTKANVSAGSIEPVVSAIEDILIAKGYTELP